MTEANLEGRRRFLARGAGLGAAAMIAGLVP